jgi:hypothetical protein
VSTILYRAGSFFYHFGVAVTILALITIATLATLASTGAVSSDVSQLLYRLATVFGFSAMAGALLGHLSRKVLEAIMPQVFQVMSIWLILTYFLPVYVPLTATLVTLISLLPLPAPVVAGLSSIVYTFVAFAMIYYIAVKVGAAPV